MIQRLFTNDLITFCISQHGYPRRVSVYINYLHMKLSSNVHSHQGFQHILAEVAPRAAVKSEINNHYQLLIVR